MVGRANSSRWFVSLKSNGSAPLLLLLQCLTWRPSWHCVLASLLLVGCWPSRL
jgi:hypothetical protein